MWWHGCDVSIVMSDSTDNVNDVTGVINVTNVMCHVLCLVWWIMSLVSHCIICATATDMVPWWGAMMFCHWCSVTDVRPPLCINMMSLCNDVRWWYQWHHCTQGHVPIKPYIVTLGESGIYNRSGSPCLVAVPPLLCPLLMVVWEMAQQGPFKHHPVIMNIVIMML